MQPSQVTLWPVKHSANELADLLPPNPGFYHEFWAASDEDLARGHSVPRSKNSPRCPQVPKIQRLGTVGRIRSNVELAIYRYRPTTPRLWSLRTRHARFLAHDPAFELRYTLPCLPNDHKPHETNTGRGEASRQAGVARFDSFEVREAGTWQDGIHRQGWVAHTLTGSTVWLWKLPPKLPAQEIYMHGIFLQSLCSLYNEYATTLVLSAYATSRHLPPC